MDCRTLDSVHERAPEHGPFLLEQIKCGGHKRRRPLVVCEEPYEPLMHLFKEDHLPCHVQIITCAYYNASLISTT
jgi:hypothetical protein